MKGLRSVGAFMVACSILCFVIAYERYQTAVITAKAVTDQLEGVEFDSVEIPIETLVAGFVGVVMLVAGVQCFLTWRANEKSGIAEPTQMLE